MNRAWILTALGKDRPGIVAHVTRVLYDLGCNLEDSAMTRLGGEFTIMLSFTSPSTLNASRIERAFATLSSKLGLAVHLKSLTASERTAHAGGKPYLISVYGGDKPGIVYKVSELLARAKVNITDVSTHRTGRRPSIYLMLLEVELPARVTPAALESKLRRLTTQLGVEVSLRASDAQVL